MKLSEAILLGMGFVQENRKRFLTTLKYEDPCGCALGTGLWAVGKRPKDSVWMDSYETFQAVYETWPWTKRLTAPCVSVAEMISNRHYLGESRESIAAWIATIEPQDTPLDVKETDTCSTMTMKTLA